MLMYHFLYRFQHKIHLQRLAQQAFLFSVVLGVIFGMYPAIKASGLQPVVALRAD